MAGIEPNHEARVTVSYYTHLMLACHRFKPLQLSKEIGEFTFADFYGSSKNAIPTIFTDPMFGSIVALHQGGQWLQLGLPGKDANNMIVQLKQRMFSWLRGDYAGFQKRNVRIGKLH